MSTWLPAECDGRQRLMAAQDEEARGNVQEVGNEVNQHLDSSPPIDCKKDVEQVQRKHKLVKWEGEREICKGWSPESTTIPPLVRAPWPLTQTKQSAASQMAKDADDAMSESSWTALAKGKERGWCSIDLELEKEKLEVVGPWSRTDGGSVDPKGKIGHRSARTKVTKEESEKPTEAEMEVVDGAVPQEASVDIQSLKKESDSGRIGRDERLREGDSGNRPGRSRGNGLRAKRPW